MANNIGWGKGATSNSIGWGQGAANNVKNWGIYYRESFSGETSLGGELSLFLTNNFKERVSADSGTFEARQCLIQLLNTI